MSEDADRRAAAMLADLEARNELLEAIAVAAPGLLASAGIRAADLPPGSTSLREIAGRAVSRVDFARRLLEELEKDYQRLKAGRFGELDWVPIHYIHRSTARRRLTAVYRSSRIGMVTPLRDGMNLVAKEYVAAQDPADPGVLILSRFAGAAEELRNALIVNPYDIGATADVIRVALEMSLSERRQRHEALMKTVESNDITAWCRSFLAALERVALPDPSREPESIARALDNLREAAKLPRSSGSKVERTSGATSVN